MAQYQVKNTSHLDKAFKVRGGFQVVPAGKDETVQDARELTEAQIDAFAREGVKVSLKAGSLDHDADGKAGGAKPNSPPSERDALKARAAELKLEFPGNIGTAKLKELVEAKEAEPKPKAFEDMSDDELKVFLAEKQVAVADETREQLLDLAKAA